MRLGAFLVLTVLTVLASSAWPERSDYSACAPDGLALGGYDVVSYWQPDGPVAGLEVLAVEHNGQTYRFANAKNRSRFVDGPEAFLPRYQGWCAATLAMGRLACPDFTNFKIEEGTLLLFELVGFTNGRVVWDSDPVDFRRRADDNAVRLLGL